tara:strand:+ start:107 stop:490 length:384 start_codon:yes stop_codon:yes gene_type:complete
VVQSNYSPLLVAAGFSAPSSLLVYNRPAEHLASLRALHDDLQADDELGYVPTSEFVITKTIDNLEIDAGEGKKAAAGRRDWKTIKRFLRELSTCTADCVDRYGKAEIERTKAHELRSQVDSWRLFIL